VKKEKSTHLYKSILLSEKSSRVTRLGSLAGHVVLFSITSVAALSVLFIIFFIGRDALPFFNLGYTIQFFTSIQWYPSADPPSFGSLAIFFGSGLVTLGAVFVAVPLGVFAAVCLSDVLPFKIRQAVKPIIEILAAIPSVAFGFFALVVFAPYLQEKGGSALAMGAWLIGVPFGLIGVFILSEMIALRLPSRITKAGRFVSFAVLGVLVFVLLRAVSARLMHVVIDSGTNALNVSIILGLMALPTVVSVAEDALQAVGRELREGALALGATRSEMVIRVLIPAASSGIIAAIILGIMRAIGETMVVWMASGNASQIPYPWYNFLEPVRTLTATIAGDMGEADQMTGSARYHVLFALALCLLVFSFVGNAVSEWISSRSRVKLEY
jgi:phosphate transport system permease protein